MSTLLLSLVLLLPLPQGDDPAVAAYRGGNLEEAQRLWTEALDGAAPGERARLLGNLAVVAHRSGDVHRAAAWYEAALRLRPRDRFLLRDLELARAQAGLPPFDDGSLSSALVSWARDWTEDEERRWALLGLAVLAAGLSLEALRGGARGRTALVAALLAQPMLLAPLVHGWLHAGEEPYVIVSPGGVLARAEPRPDASRQAHFPAGEEVRVLGQWPGWVQLEGDDGVGVWVPEESVFRLSR